MRAQATTIPPRDSAACRRRSARFRAALAVVAVFALLGLAEAADGPYAPPRPGRVDAHAFASAPEMDGRLDEWSSAAPGAEARIERAEQNHPLRRERWEGPADASARVRVGAYGESLYFGITVTDDQVFHDPSRAWWHGDSLELFINHDLEGQGTPPHEYTAGCWQIFLMPANPEIPWGVVYHGRRMHFDAGGLHGVRVVRGETREGSYDLEVEIPLQNFDIEGPGAARLGFALALNDSDEEPEKPGSYLSWNAGFDLYLHPDHFGVLHVPARAQPASGYAQQETSWWPLVALLLAIVAVVVLTGPGARLLARVGPRWKWIGLGATGVVALAVYLYGTLSVSGAYEDARETLGGLATEAQRVYAEYLAYTAGSGPGTEQERRQALRRLLSGERVPCQPGVVDAALVPLHVDGAHSDPTEALPAYDVALRSAHRFYLPRPAEGRRFALRVVPGFEPQARHSPVRLGSLAFQSRSGAEGSADVYLPPGVGGEATLTIELPSVAAWHRADWTPDRGAPPTRLRALYLVGDDGATSALALTGTTRDHVPVLAHAGGPDHGRIVEPGGTFAVPIPVLAGADRLWLLLGAAKAFPHLLGDHVLGRVTIEYDDARDPTVIDLRNGEHLTSERLLPGIRRPTGLRSREAFRWQDSMGTTHLRQALPIPIDPQRLPRVLSIENAGAGGTLRVAAGTIVRTAREVDGSPVRVVTDEYGRDGLLLAAGAPDFRPHLGPLPAGTEDAEVVRVDAGFERGPLAAPLVLFETLPPEVAATRKRARVILLACLAVALFLGVLLVVDAAGRMRQLSWRLGIGVLAAALVPLAVTIFLVERENTNRIEADHAGRARFGLQQVLGRIEAAQSRVEDAAHQLARHLVAELEPGQTAEVGRLVALHGASALDYGLAGTASITGARLPPMQIPLGESATGLHSARFLEGVGGRSGIRSSPWDGLVLVGVSRSGGPEDWVRVTVGVRVEDAFLAASLAEALDADDTAAVVLDTTGRPLVEAGRGGRDLRHAVARHQDDLRANRAGGTAALLPRAAGDAHEHLVAAAPFRQPAAPTAGAAWLALGVHRGSIDRAVASQRTPLVWLGLFGLVLVVGVAALVARRVADPVRRLVHVTDSVRQGEFDVEVPATGADEVGRLAIAFDQMRRDLKHRVEDLDFLRGAQEALAASLEFGRRADVVVQLFAGRFQTDDALLLDAQGAGGPLAVVAESTPEKRFSERAFAPTGRLASALDAKTPVDLGPAEGSEDAPAEGPMGERLLASCAAWIAVPLRAGGEVQGLAVLGWKDRAAVPQAEARRLLEPLGGIAASSLNNARLYRLAALDDVTRLPGATAFEAALRADVERAVQGGPQAVLLRIGLDHLEHVTLRRGVELSRELQRACAHALAGVVGDRAQLGRLREEQLAARLPGATPDEVRDLAEAVRERLRGVEVVPREGGEPVGTTVSIGIARCPGDARSVEFLLDAAGRALAAAQREGGDHVEDAARLDTGAVDMPPFEEGAVFRNEQMVRVVESARRAARADSSVLITGETGTGKEVIANLVHRRSARASRPFVTVNCAAFPESLLESELFGHERGAFTGAERRREGRFELADGGTLFLDEVAEMTPSAQVKLLRVLQERQFTRLGGTRTITVDVRIIAATNRDLEKAVADGAFREDLYYRLNVIRLEVPPLRDRREEIPLFVDLFLKEATRRAGGGPRALSSGAMDVLYRHPWPGNVRELKNVIERCAVLCETETVGSEHLQLDSSHSEGGPFLAPRGAPQDDLNSRQRKLLDYLARHGRCTNREYYQMAGTSPRTGLRDLQDLMQRGLLVREGKRRGAVYRLP